MSDTNVSNFTVAATINDASSGGRTFLSVCFWLWAAVGFAVIAFYFLMIPSNVGVGTSAYLSACSLFWIGGMVMFGIGAIIAGSNYQFRRPPP